MSKRRGKRARGASRPGVLCATVVCAALTAAANASQEAPLSFVREVPLGLDLYMPIPAGNPLSAAKVALGRRLFFDPVLSDDGKLSCAGCHDPNLAFTDGRSVAEGVYGRTGKRLSLIHI